METLKDITELINSIYGLPKVLILAGFSIVLGYILRLQQWFDNRRIPLVVVLVCMIGAPVLELGTYDPNVPLAPQVIVEILVGAIIGFTAWQIHNRLLRHIEKRIPWLGSLLEEADSLGQPQEKHHEQTETTTHP